MDLVLFDASWMSWNVFLACIPVLFGYLLMRAHTAIGKTITGIIWLSFLPNTLYLLTDIIHLSDDFGKVTGIGKVEIFFLYTVLVILGIITFILSLHPLETLLKEKMLHKTIAIWIVNFIIGFGMVLGRVERTNSWDVFVNFPRFIQDIIHVLTDPQKILLCLAFGLLCNIVYFTCRRLVMSEVHEIERL